jgi:TRAP-type C4-dicarboxylate transport system permease small subunit
MDSAPLPAASARAAGPAGDRLAGGLGTFAGIVLAGIMMVTVIDVFGRYVLNRPLPGSSELTEVMMAILVYAGLPVVSGRNAHISVDLFRSATSPSVARLRDAIVRLLCAAVLFLLAWRLWAYADQIRDSRDVTEYLRLPQAPFAYAMSILATVAAGFELYRFARPAPSQDAFGGDPV